MKLTGVMLGTDDAKKLSNFYTEVFGKPVFTDNNFFGFDVGGAMLMIGPHSDIKGVNESPARSMVMIVTDDVAGDFKRISSIEGAKVVAEPYNPDPSNKTTWLSTIADPDGNYFQLASPWEM